MVRTPRHIVLCGLKDVLSVGWNERAAVVVDEQRVFDDLFGFKVSKIDHRDACVGLVVDEEPISVVVAIGFRECGVVCVSPAVLFAADIAFVENFVSDSESPPLPRFWSKHTDRAENAHGRHTNDEDLP